MSLISYSMCTLCICCSKANCRLDPPNRTDKDLYVYASVYLHLFFCISIYLYRCVCICVIKNVLIGRPRSPPTPKPQSVYGPHLTPSLVGAGLTHSVMLHHFQLMIFWLRSRRR